MDDSEKDQYEKKTRYEKIIQDASAAYLTGQFKKATSMYNDALILASELKLTKMLICIIKYMICRCLLESDKFEDLSEAVTIIQTIEKSLRNRFPALYYLLAQLHCKLYRFDQALVTLSLGESVINKRDILETFYIPGTNIIIDKNNEEIWAQIKDECSSWHQPDAICNLLDCCNVTKPYVTPNKNIFKSDPAFNGMVIVNCNNKDRPCSLKYHLSCWKFKKEQLHPAQKVSDKDIIGNSCFTPNCMNGKDPCIISTIEIINSDGNSKSVVKELLNKNSKGAIKKAKVQSLKKTETFNNNKDSDSTTPKKQKQNNEEIKYPGGYNKNQILYVKENGVDGDYVDIDKKKNFLFSFFYEYIDRNAVKIKDLYKKYDEMKEDFNLEDLDILTFLLETNKIAVLNEKASDSDNVNTEGNAKTNNDIDEVFDEIMNDDEFYECVDDLSDGEINYEEKSAKILHDTRQSNNVNNCNSNHTVSDALDTQTNVCKLKLQGSSLSELKESLTFGSKSEKWGTENRKWKEYISKLEIELNECVEENTKLKKKLKINDSEIESLKKRNDDFLLKMDSFNETISTFHKQYEVMQNDNIQMKKEMIDLISTNKDLEEKLRESNNPESRRQDVLKLFQDEYKILKDCINSDWEEKFKNLEDSLEAEIQTKLTLLNKYLNSQYSIHRNMINSYIDQCNVTINIIEKINYWVERTLNIRQFTDKSQWVARLTYLTKMLVTCQTEYSSFLETLHSKSDETFKMTDITMTPLNIPKIQNFDLGEIVLLALNTSYKQQSQMMMNILVAQSNIPYVAPPRNCNQYVPQYQQYNATYQTGLLPNPTFAAPLMSNYSAPYTSSTPIVRPPISVSKPIDNPKVSKVEITEISNGLKSLNTKNLTTDYQDSESDLEEVQKESEIEISEEDKIVKHDNSYKKLTNMKTASKPVQHKNKNGKVISENESDSDGNYVNNKHNKFSKANGDLGKTSSVKQPEEMKKQVQTPVNNEKEKDPTMKKLTLSDLVKLMQKKFPGILQLDLVDILDSIRKNHNNSLSGMKISQIFAEAEKYMTNVHRLHLLQYIAFDSSESTSKNVPTRKSERTQKSELKNHSPSISHPVTVNNKIDSQSITPKKTWNTITKNEVKWTGTGELECSICMNLIKKTNPYTLSCNHKFHTQCIKTWLKSDRSCPNCRIAVTDYDDFPPLPA